MSYQPLLTPTLNKPNIKNMNINISFIKKCQMWISQYWLNRQETQKYYVGVHFAITVIELTVHTHTLDLMISRDGIVFQLFSPK